MAYVAKEIEKLVKELTELAKNKKTHPVVGTGQCVEVPKFYAGAPATPLWKEGKQVRGNLNLAAGTAIATFINGKYPSLAHGNHAALYLKQDASGIYVVDQWVRVKKLQTRKIFFKGFNSDGTPVGGASDNGDAFSVIE